MKKFIAMALALVLVAGISVAGTTAYLQSEDSDVNVMTLGNVKIEQIEQERDENGNLVNFTQAKPAFPAVGEIAWADKGVVVNGTEYKVFAPGLKNVVDKIVTVENTGKSDAYIRTIVAIEAPDFDPNDLIHIGYNDTGVSMSAPVTAVIDGTDYVVFTFTYTDALEPGKSSAPSLMQVFLDSKATNEDVAKFGDSWEILVASQAVQTQGFADAATALNTAFGTGHPWANGVVVPDHFVSTLNELQAAFAEGGNILLADDIAMEETLYVEDGAKVHLNMNGKKMTAGTIDPESGFLWVNEGGSLTIDGNGTFDLGTNPGLSFIIPEGEVVIENGTFIREVSAGTAPAAVGGMFVGTKTGSLVIKDGYFDGGYYDKNAELAFNGGFTETADDIANRGQSSDANVVRVALKNNVIKNLNMSAANVKVYGGTFVGVNPAWGDEGCMLPTTPNYLRPWSYYQGAFLDGQTFNENGIVLPAGYSIAQGTTADGRPTYTVNYNG